MSRTYGKAQDLIDFTRASGGTALRRVKYGAELVTNGTFDTDSDWVLSGDATISGGKATLSAQYGVIQQNISITNGQLVRISYEVVSNTDEANPNLALSSSGFTNSTTFINNDVGNHTIDVVVEDATKPLRFVLALATTIVIDNVSVKEVTFDTSDGDLILFNHPNNIPRIEYDSQGNLLGLLVEESRTNLIPYSEDFNQWFTQAFATISTNTTQDPAGGFTASTLSLGSANNSAIRNQTPYSAGTYTLSFWVKTPSGTKDFRLSFYNATDGTVSSGDFTATDKWQLFSFECSPTVTTANWQIRNSSGGGEGTLHIWGAQLEVGSFPTSYIPTSGSTATRSADVASLSTSAFGYRQDEGTVVVEAISNDAEARFFSLDDTTFSNRIHMRTNVDGGGIRTFVNTGGTSYTNVTAGTYNFGDSVKLSLAFKQNDLASYADGTQLTTDSTVEVPPVTQLQIGKGIYTPPLNGHIKSIKYIPRRLTNDQLVELTS